MKRILALDLSLTTCGVCRLVDLRAGAPLFVTDTVTIPRLRVPGKRPGTEIFGPPRVGCDRLAWWKRWLIEEIASGCELVIMEAPAFRASGNNSDIGELAGVVKLTLHERQVPLVVVPPAAIKKFATGIGNCDKQRMLDTAALEFGEQVKDEHQADAAWLCKIAYQAFSNGEPENAYRLALATKLREGKEP